jgi:hypothetical protein
MGTWRPAWNRYTVMEQRSVRFKPVRKKFKAVRNLMSADFASEYVAEMGCRWRDRRLLRDVRGERATCWLEPTGESAPLVTIRIATKDRPELLLERSVAAALRQTYTNLEILVVGDGCDARTAEALSSVDDPRLRYVNLGRSGRYPDNPVDRWLVAGSLPMNAGLLLAAGDWIAPCDDDDEFTDNHVQRLLEHARNNDLEFAWSKSQIFHPDGSVTYFGDERFRGVTHGSMIYSMGLQFFMYSRTSHRMKAPFDQNLWWRMRNAGVRMGFLDAVTYRYWPAGIAQYEVGDTVIGSLEEFKA